MSTRNLKGQPKTKTTTTTSTPSSVPPKLVTATLKRPAEDTPTREAKKTKLDIITIEVDSDGNEGAEESDEEDGQQELSEDVKDRLDYLEGLVETLSKSYLKDVMKGISFYGSRSGTNRAMAAAIVEELTQCAQGGSDLKDQETVIKRVYKSCYGSCGMDSDEEESNYDD